MIRHHTFHSQKRMRRAIPALLAVGATTAFPARATVTSYATGGVTVSHDSSDEGVYYDTPANEVGYNTQILRLPKSAPASYVTIYHSEPRNKPVGHPGDSIKVGTARGAFSYKMPENKAFRLWGVQDDPENILYSPRIAGLVGWSGTGNPMLVRGKPGDPHYYAFFLAVRDDNNDRKGTDYHHLLCQARTRNFVDWQIRSRNGDVVAWTPFRDSATVYDRRAATIEDVEGKIIANQKAVAVDQTQGLIGSMCYVNGLYHYFYTDVAQDGATYLYLRTSPDVSSLKPTWSAARQISQEKLMFGTVIRVAKARGANRWALLYNGYRLVAGVPRQDLMLQLTQTLDVGEVGALTFYTSHVSGLGISDKALGLASGNSYAQHYFLTDEWGNLAVPDSEDGNVKRGGLITWTDVHPSLFGGKIYHAGFEVS